MDEKHPKRPLSPYAASKIGADAIGLSFHAAYGLPVSIVRLFNTYGPRQSDRAVIPTIICQALTSKEIRLGNTAPTRDFTFVSDTVDGFLRIGAADGTIGEEVQLGTGVEISIGDIAARIGGMLASKITIVPAPERVRQAGCEVTRLVSDNGKARRLAQWEPRVTLDEGLPRTIEWVRMRLADYAPGEYRV
jgi:dTDP-glucose 4,6-dehydratase